MIEQHIKLSNK